MHRKPKILYSLFGAKKRLAKPSRPIQGNGQPMHVHTPSVTPSVQTNKIVSPTFAPGTLERLAKKYQSLEPHIVHDSHTHYPNAIHRKNAKYVLVMNSKGGSGKTTISTNIASLLATRDEKNRVVLVDHDRQGSSVRWLKSRSTLHKRITGIYPARDNLVKFKRTWRLQVQANATHVVVDSPAALSGLDLSDRIRESQIIIIPVMPSAIDIAATADFVSKIFINPAYLNAKKTMCVVANGVNKNLHNYEKLERFLFSLHIPFISVFSDNKQYLLAAENGCGINELPNIQFPYKDMPEWEKLIRWIESH